MEWFRLNRAAHRDIGYLLCSLVAVYCVSGLAVNHIEDWNPNLSIRHVPVDLGALPDGDLGQWELAVVQRLALDPAEVQGRHRSKPNEFRVFLGEGGEVRVDPATGTGTWTQIHERRGLFEFNTLHLNHLKGVWTYVADAFAILLLFLSVSGLFMLRGEKGFWGRGKWLAAAGLVVPVAAVAYYHATR